MVSGRNALVGSLFVVAGALMFVSKYISLSHYAWPFFIIIPGLMLFVLTYSGAKISSGFAIPATLLTSIGLILLSQVITGRFETWAYAWTLLLVAVGLGTILQGRLERLEFRQIVGSRIIAAGLISFVLFSFFFEVLIFHSWIQGFLGSMVFPVVLIALGLFVLKSKAIAH